MKQRAKLLWVTLTVLMVLGLGVSLSGLMPTAQAAVPVSTQADLQQAILNNNDVTLTSDIVLSSNVYASGKTTTIDGAGHTITLQSGNYRHFEFNQATVTFKNIKLQGISGTTGGGIKAISSNIIMEQSTIIDCTISDNGGGIFAGDESNVILTDTTIKSCKAELGGGVFAVDSPVKLSGSRIESCKATRYGGGLFANYASPVTLTDSTIYACIATSAGGGIYARYGASVNLTSNSIQGGISDGNGGALYIDASCKLNLTGSTITYGTAERGGGIYARHAEVIISDSTFMGCTTYNRVDSEGGGIYAIGDTCTVKITGTTFTYCTADISGGGIYSSGAAISLTDSTLYLCLAANGAGIASYYNSAVSLSGSTINKCIANYGGGIYSHSSSVILTGSTIQNCSADYYYGGAICLVSKSSITSDATTRYENNNSAITYVGNDKDEIKYACLSIISSYDANGTPVYSGALNGNDIYWSDNMGAEAYIVTFDSNGGSPVGQQLVAKGSTSTEPAAPTRSRYDFTGWYTDYELTEKYAFDASVNNSFTLYAGWQEQPIHEPYIDGYPNNTFKHEAMVSRAEVAQMLYNIADEPYTGAGSTFDDVPSDSWYYNAVSYLSERGVITGYPDGSFDPTNKISRAELVKMAVEFAEVTGIAQDCFPDVSAGYWASEYINAAKEAGYINGYPNGYFYPEQYITRAETVTIINAMLGRTINEDILKDLTMPFTDVPDTHWAYYEILEASVEHAHP